jgi:HK97 family phage major capsid protein
MKSKTDLLLATGPLNLAERYLLAADERGYAASVLSAAELLAQFRTIVDGPTGAPNAPWNEDDAQLMPFAGGRIAPLFRRVVQLHPIATVPEETTGRTDGAAATDYNTAATERSTGFTKIQLGETRIAESATVDKNVPDDAPTFDGILREIIAGSMARRLDLELTAGDGTGTGEAAHLLGIANQTLTAVAVGAGTVADALVTSAVAIRSGDYLGPITHVLSPTDVGKLVGLKSTAGQPIIEDVRAQLAMLNADNYVTSSLLTPGTAYSGDFSQATLYIRSGLDISTSPDHASNFLAGVTTYLAELRVAFRLHRKAAFRQITGI